MSESISFILQSFLVFPLWLDRSAMATPELPAPDNAAAGPSTIPRTAPGRYRLAHSFAAHSRAVTALQISNDGQTLISAGADGYLHFWSVLLVSPPFMCAPPFLSFPSRRVPI